MALITEISPQVKDKERCNIYVDGRFYCGLRLETAVRCRLRVPYALFEQAQRMVDTDILLGVLGSGFANAIFMLPGSVIVSFSPPWVGGFFFSTMAEFCQVRYIPVYNYSIVPPNECTGLITEYGEMTGKSEYCLSTLYTATVYFNLGAVSTILRQALTHVRVFKYHTQ